MSQPRCTHRLYTYHTDATYSINTHSPPPPLRSLAPSLLCSIPPSLALSLVTLSHTLPPSTSGYPPCSVTHKHLCSCHFSWCSYKWKLCFTYSLLFVFMRLHTGCPVARGNSPSTSGQKGSVVDICVTWLYFSTFVSRSLWILVQLTEFCMRWVSATAVV